MEANVPTLEERRFVFDYYINEAKKKNQEFSDKDKRLKNVTRGTEIGEYVDLLVLFKNISLISTEVSEALEAVRKSSFIKNGEWKGTVEEELADIFLRLISTAAEHEIDLLTMIETKRFYNNERELKHGKEL